MDIREAIKDVAKRSRIALEHAETEEATKNGVIMPLIRALGFDVFDLSQVVPEFHADVGVKKGEKVDYALKIDGKIVMLVEAKPRTVELGNAQYTQLYRYFAVTEAKIAILTNGAQAWFFSDIDEKNKMDKRPFFKFDLESYDEQDVKELAKFHRDSFVIDNILQAASTLKYTSAAANYINQQMQNPDDEFIRVVAKQIHDGMITKGVVDQLRPSIIAAFQKILRDRIQDRLNVALEEPAIVKTESQPEPEKSTGSDGIETTDEELSAFFMIQAIGSEIAPAERIFIRDSKSYCSVNFDDNNRKPICRLYFNAKSSKHIGVFDDQKVETKHKLGSLSDIYKMKGQIQSVIMSYMQ